MKSQPGVPFAESQPVDEADQVVSDLFRRAAELIDLTQSHPRPGEPTSPFQRLIRTLLDVINEDEELAGEIQRLPPMMGTGMLLPTVFTGLFSGKPRALTVDLEDTQKDLTPRELEILTLLARGYSHKEAAAQLRPIKGKKKTLAEGTVRKHINNIHRSLVVGTTHEAIIKARALGLIEVDISDLIEPLRADYRMDYHTLVYNLLNGLRRGENHWDELTLQIGGVGLLLILLPCLQGCLGAFSPSALLPRGQGIIHRLTPKGVLEVFHYGENLHHPRGLAFAPPEARKQGFTPGSLYLIDDADVPYTVGCNLPCSLNSDQVVELSQNGQYVRAFTGGTHYSSRLALSQDLAFTSSGDLLATSGRANAILAFTEGGARVRRFAHVVPYGGLEADCQGRVYLVGGWIKDSAVRVFDPTGALLRTIGSAAGHVYKGIAVDPAGKLYIANHPGNIVEVYSPGGHHLTGMTAGLVEPLFLAPGPRNTLYVVDGDQDSIKILDVNTGALQSSIPAPEGCRFSGLTFHNGSLYTAAIKD